MEEPIKWAQILHDTPDLFPWVCLVIICLVVLSQHKRILGYFDARIGAYNAKKQSDAVLAELIRNNTAALNNNTAALESVKTDRGETRRLLSFHEQASVERIEALRGDISNVRSDISHVQTVVNRVDETLTDNNKILGLIEDRTEGGR